MLWDGCLTCLSLCNVGVLRPNGWMDQDATWYGDRPRPAGDILLDEDWGPSSTPTKRGTAAPPLSRFTNGENRGPCLLWPNGWMDQDATWYAGTPQPKRHCVRWGPSPRKGSQQPPPLSAHDCCGQTVAHLSNC